MTTEIHVSLQKFSGGFAGTTHYSLTIAIPVTKSTWNDDEDLENEARANAQKIIDEKFPEAQIKIEELFITNNFSF